MSPIQGGSAGGDALTTNPLSQFAATTSLQLKGVLSDETGSGASVFANSPALITPTGIVKGDVGLGNVDNTSDAGKPVSTAQQTALDLKSNLASPTFTGTVTLPSGQALVAPALGTPASGTLTNCSIPDSATFTHDLTTVPNATGGWNEYFVTSSDYTTTTLVAGTDITGLTTGIMSVSTVYEFQFMLRLLNAADAAGMKIAYHGAGTGTAATVFSNYQANSTTSSNTTQAALSAVDTLSGIMVAYTGGEGIVQGYGYFKSTSTGNPTMSIQLAKITGNTATCRVGSVLRVRKAHT